MNLCLRDGIKSCVNHCHCQCRVHCSQFGISSVLAAHLQCQEARAGLEKFTSLRTLSTWYKSTQIRSNCLNRSISPQPHLCAIFWYPRKVSTHHVLIFAALNRFGCFFQVSRCEQDLMCSSCSLCTHVIFTRFGGTESTPTQRRFVGEHKSCLAMVAPKTPIQSFTPPLSNYLFAVTSGDSRTRQVHARSVTKSMTRLEVSAHLRSHHREGISRRSGQ